LQYDDCLPFLAAPLPSQVWEAACGADSPLLAPGTAARLAPEDASVAAEAAEVLLTQVSQGAAPQEFACLSACLALAAGKDKMPLRRSALCPPLDLV
jgi:hypothetical protein